MSLPEISRIEVDAEKDLAILRILPDHLDFEQRLAFSRACSELLAAPVNRLVVDLTHVERIFSVFVGGLADLALRSEDAAKALTILARPPVAEIFRKVNLASPLNVHVVDEEPRS